MHSVPSCSWVLRDTAAKWGHQPLLRSRLQGYIYFCIRFQQIWLPQKDIFKTVLKWRFLKKQKQKNKKKETTKSDMCKQEKCKKHTHIYFWVCAKTTVVLYIIHQIATCNCGYIYWVRHKTTSPICALHQKHLKNNNSLDWQLILNINSHSKKY